MNTRARWAERVKGWKTSGLTSTEYSEGKPFTAGGLRHWSYRLGMTKARARGISVKLARVVPIKAYESGPETTGREEMAAHGRSPSSTEQSVGIVVEMSGARVAVPPGVDRATLGAVLEVLRQCGGGR